MKSINIIFLAFILAGIFYHLTTQTAISAEYPDFTKIVGEWIRPDGGYIVHVRDVKSDGSADVGYFNPAKINVAEASVSYWKGLVKLFIKLQDKGYPGSTYTLYYYAEKDAMVGQLLDKLDKLGIIDNTIVMYSTDNGAEVLSWPDGAMIPFAGEKNTTWEGGFRIPMMVKWPGKIKPGQVFNDIISLEDWLPTLVAAAGDPNIKEKLLKGHKAGKMTYNVHLDGYNFLPYLTGKAKKGPREEMFYFTDGGSLSAFRYNDWKLMFSIQEATGFDVWTTPFTERRMPLILNLRRDPFERAWHEGIGYKRWAMEHMYVMVPAMGYVQKFLMTFKDYPQRQEVATWTLDKVIEKLTPKTN